MRRAVGACSGSCALGTSHVHASRRVTVGFGVARNAWAGENKSTRRDETWGKKVRENILKK
jgi:O-glycosyl hydrolase